MTSAGRALRSWARRVVAISEAGTESGEPGVGSGEDDPMRAVGAVVVAVSRTLPGPSIEEALFGAGRRVVADPVGEPADLVELAESAGELTGPVELAELVELAGELPLPPGGWGDVWLPGAVHEQAVGGDRRSARGAWYTPTQVVRGLVALATPYGPPTSVVDPTCGGGAFLLAALERYRELGLGVEEAMALVGGTDIDADAVTTSRWSMALWAAANGADPEWAVRTATGQVGVADALDPRVGPRSEGTLVIGNPPFATPLRSGRLPEGAEALRVANRDLLGPYSDLAALHLLTAVRSIGAGSTVALVLPQSVLSGRDTGELRRFCQDRAPLQALWACRESVFDAGVKACAVVLRCGEPPPAEVALAAGPEVAVVARPDPTPPTGDRWALLAARALGAPTLPPTMAERLDGGVVGRSGDSGRLGDLVSATAGFRDEYYGLVAACREWDGSPGAEPNRLITVGSVDPLVVGWGWTACRIGGRRWVRPVVDLDMLDGKVRRWVDGRLAPKVVLATQSKVLEPVVDREGSLVPATPLIAVSAKPEDLGRVAAVLLAPPVVAWAWQRWFGSALSVDALKLAASQVLELPLPADRSAWEEASVVVAGADSADPVAAAEAARDAAALMNRAYGADERVLDWWLARAGGSGSRPRRLGWTG